MCDSTGNVRGRIADRHLACRHRVRHLVEIALELLWLAASFGIGLVEYHTFMSGAL
jgi:hypothetical protein